jgi:hypothetical protein
MSRGPVARSKAIGEQLPRSLVTLARIDIRAQNHAVVEGAADPFPAPVSHARGRARERTKAVSAPPGGVGTHVADSGPNRNTAADRPLCTHRADCVHTGGDDE